MKNKKIVLVRSSKKTYEFEIFDIDESRKFEIPDHIYLLLQWDESKDIKHINHRVGQFSNVMEWPDADILPFIERSKEDKFNYIGILLNIEDNKFYEDIKNGPLSIIQKPIKL